MRKRRCGSGGSKSNQTGAVGTEAAAREALARNAKSFGYPSGGFVERIEYSLIYSMLCEPKIYPEDVVLKHIDAEDMQVYLQVSSENGSMAAAQGQGGVQEEEEVSYAQLGALLALSAEKFPPSQSHLPGSEDKAVEGSDSVPARLCSAVLGAVIKYAEAHGLDREAEIQELLESVEKHGTRRSNKAAMKNIIPFYVGYAASLVTANPLPMLLGASVTIASDAKKKKERRNHLAISQVATRKADIETAGLLDEAA